MVTYPLPRIAVPLTAAALALAACSAPAAPSHHGAVHAAGAIGLRPGRSAYLQQVSTGGKPCAVVGAAGSIWVADFANGRVSRLNPATGVVTAQVKTGSQPCGMAYGAGSVWVEDYGDGTVTRISTATLRTRSYTVGSLPYDVTFAGGAAWVTNYGDNTVTRIDAATGQTRALAVGGSPEGIARAAGAVWVANYTSGTVTRIDTTSMRETTIRIGGSPAWTAYTAGTVWVGDQAAGQIVRIDARTGAISGRAKVGAMPNDGDVLAGAVWFPDKNGGLYRIDLHSDAVTGPFPLDAANPFTLAAYDHRLWIANFGGTNVVVVNPARLPSRAP